MEARTPLTGSRLKYRHEFEHRGHGIVAIYSYGPAGEHDALVKSATQLMRQRFGVTGALSSGGISGYPENRPTPDPDWMTAICETQTIFCIDAVGGPNRPKLKACPPAKADWVLECQTDTEDEFTEPAYFTGPLENGNVWREIAAGVAGAGVRIMRAEVTAPSGGRYWFLADEGPIVILEG